jgi:hypothetical protein
MKTPYNFSVLRYIHDVVTGEFVNVGVVLYAPRAKFLSALCTSRYGRLSKMFNNVNGEHFKHVVRYIQAQLEEEGERLTNELPFNEMPKSVLEFTAKVLPRDDSSLQFSPEGFGLTENPQLTLEQLYTRYVEQYFEKADRPIRTNEDVWRVFKKPLEEKRILAKLVPHQISGQNYEYEFKYAWKNGVWNMQEPISFDLVEAGSITDKANAWLGRITSLVDGGEKFYLNLLVGAPQDERLMSAFIKAENILHRMPCPHDFVREYQADNFAQQLKKEIEEHKV